VEPALDVPSPARPHRPPGAALPRGLSIALAANLLFLAILVGIGVPKIPAQAMAIALVTPWNFVANKLWSFRRQPAA
jgi:hypothetical protein